MFGLILVYILTAVGVLGSFVQPLIGLYIYVLFAMLRPQYLWSFAGNMDGMSLYVGVATLIGWGLKGFGGLNLGRSKPIIWTLIAFLLWAQLSSSLGINPQWSSPWVYELAKIVGPFMVGVTMMNDPKAIRTMMWIIVGSHGYIGYEMNNWYYVRGYNFVHESGYGFMDNNSFALSLVATVGLAATLTLVARTWWEKLAATGCGLLIVSTLVLTYSRGGLLGLGIVGIGAFFMIPKRPTYVILMLLGAIGTARLIGPEVRARFATVFAEEQDRDASAQSRVELWKACLDVASKNPLTGIGPRNFPAVAHEYGFTRGKEAHSTWMQGAAEMGFVGIGLLISFYLVTMAKLIPRALRKWTNENKQESAFAAGVLISLAGFFVTAQFVTMAGLETPYYIVMVAAAMIKAPSLASATSAVSATLSDTGEALAIEPARTFGIASTFRPRVPSAR